MPYQNDIGTVIEAQITEGGEPLALPSDVVAYFRIQKPNGQVVTRLASLQADGSDGMIEYIIVAGDFDQFGRYLFQGHVAFGSGSWSTKIESLEVESILKNRK